MLFWEKLNDKLWAYAVPSGAFNGGSCQLFDGNQTALVLAECSSVSYVR